MTALIAAELLKLRTTRTFALLVAGALGMAVLVCGLVPALAPALDDEDQRSLLQTGFTGGYVVVLAVLGMAGEWRHRTIAGALLAAPDRLRFFAAKVAAFAIAGALLSLAVTLFSYLLMTVVLAGQDAVVLEVGEFVDGVLWKNVVVAAYYGVLGVAVGALIRNQAGALVTVLLLLFVVEPTVIGFWPDEGRFLPFTGASASLARERNDLFDPGVSLLLMLAWTAVLCGAAAALLRRRDVL